MVSREEIAMNFDKDLKDLTDIPALSGHEDKMIDYVLEKLRKTCQRIHVDKLGNITATYPGTEKDGTSIAFFAHMDEVGLIVRKIEDNGFLRLERVGGVPEKVLPAAFLEVHTLDETKSYRGVVGNTSHHLTPADKKFAVTTITELYVDLGCKSKEEVLEKGVAVGSVVTYLPNYTSLGNYVASKSLDDRMGIYALLSMAEKLDQSEHKADVHLIFTVQEEFNIRSSTPTFHRLQPDAAICVDISPACDTPELKGRYEMELDKGVAIMYMNFHGRGTLGGLLPNPKLNAFLEETAKEEGLKCQKEVVIGVITDDAFTQLAGTEGIPMAHLSIPLRYTHSLVEVASRQDIEDCIALMMAAACRFSRQVDLTRGIKK